MAEHSEAPKTSNPTEKSDSGYQPLGYGAVRPDYSGFPFHERRFPHQPGDSLEPVKEVMEIQKARSASAPADSWFLLRSILQRPILKRQLRRFRLLRPSVQAAYFFPFGDGSPVLNWPLDPARAP